MDATMDDTEDEQDDDDDDDDDEDDDETGETSALDSCCWTVALVLAAVTGDCSDPLAASTTGFWWTLW